MASHFRNSALDTPTIDTGAVAGVDRLEVTGASRILFAPTFDQGNVKGLAEDHKPLLTTASRPVFSQNTCTSPPWLLRDACGKAAADQSNELLPASNMVYRHQQAGFADHQQVQHAPRQPNRIITADQPSTGVQTRLSPDIDSYNSYESEQTADRRGHSGQGSPYFDSPTDAVQAFKGAFADSSNKSLPASRQAQQAQQAKQVQQAQQARHALQKQQELQSQQAQFTQQAQQQAQQLQGNMRTQSMAAVKGPLPEQDRSGSAGKPPSMCGQTHPSGSGAPISHSQRLNPHHSYPHLCSRSQEHNGLARSYTHQQQRSGMNPRGSFEQGMQAQLTRSGTVQLTHPMYPGQMHAGQKRPLAAAANWSGPEGYGNGPPGYGRGDPSPLYGNSCSKTMKRSGASFDPAATSSMLSDASNALECSEEMQPDALLQDGPLDLYMDPFDSPSRPNHPAGTSTPSPVLQDSPIPPGHCFPNQKYPQQSSMPKQATLLGLSPMHALSPFQLPQQTVSPQPFPPWPRHPTQTQLNLPQPQPQNSSQQAFADSQHQATPYMAQNPLVQQGLVPISASTAASQSRDFEDFMMGMMGIFDAPSSLPSPVPAQRQAPLHQPAAHPSAAERSGPQRSSGLTAEPSHAQNSLAADSAAWYARALAAQGTGSAGQPSSSALLAMAMDLANQQTACHAPTSAADPLRVQQSGNKLQQDLPLGGAQSNVEQTSRGPSRGALARSRGPNAASLTDSMSALSSPRGADSTTTMQVGSQGTGWDTGSFSTQLHNSSRGSFSKEGTASQLSEDACQLSDQQTSKADSKQAKSRPIRQARAKRVPKRLADDASEAVAASQGPSRGSKGRAEGCKDANPKRAKRGFSKPPAPVSLAQLKPFDDTVGTISEDFFAQLNINLGASSKPAPAATSGQPSTGSIRIYHGGVLQAAMAGPMSGSAIKLSNNCPAAWPLSHAVKRERPNAADISSQEQPNGSDLAHLMLS